MKIVFFFSNRNNSKDNIFVNNILDRLKLEVVKINIDNKKINLKSTPAIQVNNKKVFSLR